MKHITTKILMLLPLTLLFSSCSPNEDKSDAYGNFEATEITVSSQAQGTLKDLKIQRGDQLSEGQVLGYVDTSALHLQRKELQARKASVSSKLATLNSQTAIRKQELENLMTSYNRIKKLIADNAATRQQLDDIEGKVKLARKQVEASQIQKQEVIAERNVLDVKTEQVEDKIEKAVITNPVKGTVINKFVDKGELVAPGKPLYKVAGLDKLELKVYISGAQLPHVKLGQQVEVLIDDDKKNNRKLSGTVTWIADDAEFTPKVIQTKEERVKLVYAVKIEVINDGSLKIGMPGEANF